MTTNMDSHKSSSRSLLNSAIEDSIKQSWREGRRKQEGKEEEKTALSYDDGGKQQLQPDEADGSADGSSTSSPIDMAIAEIHDEFNEGDENDDLLVEEEKKGGKVAENSENNNDIQHNDTENRTALQEKLKTTRSSGDVISEKKKSTNTSVISSGGDEQDRSSANGKKQKKKIPQLGSFVSIAGKKKKKKDKDNELTEFEVKEEVDEQPNEEQNHMTKQEDDNGNKISALTSMENDLQNNDDETTTEEENVIIVVDEKREGGMPITGSKINKSKMEEKGKFFLSGKNKTKAILFLMGIIITASIVLVGKFGDRPSLLLLPNFNCMLYNFLSSSKLLKPQKQKQEQRTLNIAEEEQQQRTDEQPISSTYFFKSLITFPTKKKDPSLNKNQKELPDATPEEKSKNIAAKNVNSFFNRKNMQIKGLTNSNNPTSSSLLGTSLLLKYLSPSSISQPDPLELNVLSYDDSKKGNTTDNNSKLLSNSSIMNRGWWYKYVFGGIGLGAISFQIMISIQNNNN